MSQPVPTKGEMDFLEYSLILVFGTLVVFSILAVVGMQVMEVFTGIMHALLGN